MIKYKLICKDCNTSFDSWFASSKEFEKLKKKKFLNCHNCDSKNIEKTLMAPKLINKSNLGLTNSKKANYIKINKKLRDQFIIITKKGPKEFLVLQLTGNYKN